MTVVSLDLIHDCLIDNILLLTISLILSQPQLHCISNDRLLPARRWYLRLGNLSLLIDLPKPLSYHFLLLIFNSLLLPLLILGLLPSDLTVSLSYLLLFQYTPCGCSLSLLTHSQGVLAQLLNTIMLWMLQLFDRGLLELAWGKGGRSASFLRFDGRFSRLGGRCTL